MRRITNQDAGKNIEIKTIMAAISEKMIATIMAR
jgi:hypothetical protein